MAKDKLLISVTISKELWKKGKEKIYIQKNSAIFITKCNELELLTCGGYKNTEK